MSATLIFSNNNRVSEYHKKNIFVGEWLLLNNKKKIKKYEVIKFKEKKEDKLKDFKYVKKIYFRMIFVFF